MQTAPGDPQSSADISYPASDFRAAWGRYLLSRLGHSGGSKTRKTIQTNDSHRTSTDFHPHKLKLMLHENPLVVLHYGLNKQGKRDCVPHGISFIFHTRSPLAELAAGATVALNY